MELFMVFEPDPGVRRQARNMYWPVAVAASLANSVEHVGLLAVPRQARKDQHCGASRGFWVGRTGLIVHPVQRNLTTVNRTDELTVKWSKKTEILKKETDDFVSQQEDDNRSLFILAISDGGSGLDEGTDQGLKPASPAPRSGTEALSHHRTALV